MSWGDLHWGGSGWGGDTDVPLILQAAVARRENAIQIAFSRPVYTSGINDPGDALQPSFYVVTEVAGTIGYDGTSVRKVSVVSLALVEVTGTFLGQYLELTLDRMMTPYPAQYLVTVSNQIVTLDKLDSIEPTGLTAGLDSVYRKLVVPSTETTTPSRDLANPSTLSAARDPLSDPENPLNLGTMPVDDTGDYAFDEGLTGYKKRILRRLITVPGGFVHLGDEYGLGVTSFGKKLATAAVISEIASQAEAQIAKEPETLKVQVTARQDTPGSVRFSIFARTKSGQDASMSVPFAIGSS